MVAWTRRRFLQAGAAGLGAGLGTGLVPPLMPLSAASAGAVREFTLVAQPGRAPVVGAPHPETAVWTYNGAFPGPLLRARQGETLRVNFVNRLPDPSTIHWHGIRLPNAMDGVPGLTQPPVPPGGEFRYEFRLPDAGTYWYHPHLDSSRQLGRGLYGALIVDEAAPPAFDRDVVWVLSDFVLGADASIAGGFGNMFDAAHAGRIGNTVMINGRVPAEVTLRPGERVRLRLVNAANARIFRLRFGRLPATLLALDGHPVEPVSAGEGVVLGPGMRADLLLEAGADGERHTVVDDYYRGRAYRLVDLAVAGASPIARAQGAPPRLPDNPLAEPVPEGAERLKLVMGGGAMSPGMREAMRAGAAWTINGKAQTGHAAGGHAGHAHAPMYRLRLGRSYVFEVHNDTRWPHPLHIHGVAFRVLSMNGRPLAQRPWRDTVLLEPEMRAEIAFVADNPGDWMIHCHILEHQEAGLMTSMRIE
ncbi:MAG: multicopper oxidase family protein [Betaproteobacteria bacterium]|nr:multicopper oxidase family protein [Betaproteobacteria bacterium]